MGTILTFAAGGVMAGSCFSWHIGGSTGFMRRCFSWPTGGSTGVLGCCISWPIGGSTCVVPELMTALVGVIFPWSADTGGGDSARSLSVSVVSTVVDEVGDNGTHAMNKNRGTIMIL